MKLKISIIATAENITIFEIDKDKSLVLNKEKAPELFEEVMEHLNEQDYEWISDSLSTIKDIYAEIVKNSRGLFKQTSTGQIEIEKLGIIVPHALGKKMQELQMNLSQENEVKFISLLRFWKKLAQNPSPEAREELFLFLQSNNVPITENGDFIMEKGVNQRAGSYFGDLVDCRTGTIDNSIGQRVQENRSVIDTNRHKTCSRGLHVGAPDYVRLHWASDVIIECLVNPTDVVTIPSDYNNTKMRVCEYKVIGYSPKNSRNGDEVASLQDILTNPIAEHDEKMQKKLHFTKSKKIQPREVTTEKFESIEPELIMGLKHMTAREIVKLVKDVTGYEITYSLKSKRSILKKAKEILFEQFIHEYLTSEEVLENVGSMSEEMGLTEDEKTLMSTIEDLHVYKSVSNDFIETAPITDIAIFTASKFNEKIDLTKSNNAIRNEFAWRLLNAGYSIT